MSCDALFSFLAAHRGALETGAYFVVTAFVRTMPEPGTLWTWQAIYAWIFDGLHQTFNIKSVNRST